MYDYILGGAHNFAVDRELGDEVIRTCPDGAESMRANRIFLRRAVRHLVELGARQFLDIGSGIPTVGNVHEVARRVAPECTVLYVDIDPVAVAHSEAILLGDDRAGVICADLRDPDLIIEEASRLGLVDFDRPVAVLLAGVMHFLAPADDPDAIVARLRSKLGKGGYLLISHVTEDRQTPEAIAAQRLASRTPTPINSRTHAEIARWFDGMKMLDPGLVFIPQWRPDPGEEVEHPDRIGAYAGVGCVV